MLFGPKWLSRNESKAVEAVKKLTDPEKLCAIVKNDRVKPEARFTAAKQLEDDGMLVWLEKNAPDSLTRYRASNALSERKKKREEDKVIDQLNNTKDLGFIIKQYLWNRSAYGVNPVGSVRILSRAEELMRGFGEEDFLRFIIETPIKYTSLHEYALERIASPELLDRIAEAEFKFEIEDPKDESEKRTLRISQGEAEKLKKTAREKAEKIRHDSICGGKHDWEIISRENTELGEGGDFRLIYETQRCRRCGETKKQYLWPDGTPFIKPSKRPGR